MHKATHRNIRRQVLQGFLLGLVLVPTILVWLLVGSLPFGYYPVIIHGSSMEPLLRDDDAVLVKELDVADVRVGDIVMMSPPDEQSVTHRLIKMQPLSRGGFLLVTKGDASQFTEEWEINADGTVEVLVACVPLAGRILEFLHSMFGIALLIGVIIILAAIWLCRRESSLSSDGSEIGGDNA